MDTKKYIKVEWKDTPDQFSDSKQREIERELQKKYDAQNVKVVPVAISNKSESDTSDVKADVSEEISDVSYQRKLMDKFINNKGYNVNWELITKLDNNVNEELKENKDVLSKFKDINVRRIKLSNFLSFDNKEQELDFGKFEGITTILSEPENYAGKTILIIDTLLFLFFGDTTRTNAHEEIFNFYTDSNEVRVKGEVEINGVYYYIERKLERNFKSRGKNKGQAEVNQKLDFSYDDGSGNKVSLNGKSPQATTTNIKEIIGNKDDFLVTIITTANNLEDMIDSKPTERGKIFTRFIGLELFREKEEIAKKKYREWTPNTKLHYYDFEELKKGNENKEEEIKQLNEAIKLKREELTAIDNKINEEQENKDQLFYKKYSIDEDLLNISEDYIIDNINKLQQSVDDLQKEIDNNNTKLKEPKNKFDEEEYNSLKSKKDELVNQYYKYSNSINEKEKKITELKNSEYCPTCKQPLKDVDHTNEIEELNENVINEKKEFEIIQKDIDSYKEKLSNLDELKKEWEEYEKTQVLIQKKQVELEKYENNLQKGQDKLQRFRDNQSKIEENHKTDQKITEYIAKLEDLSKQRETIILEINTKQNEIDQKSQEITNNNQIIEEINKEKKIDKVFQVYLEMFGKHGISKMVLGSMVPIINSYLDQFLSDVANFNLEVSLNDKDEVDFWMHDTEKDKYQPLRMGSGYEKTVSALALRCVLSKICSLPKPNIIIFDEPFGKVGQKENLYKLESLFYQINKYFNNIFILTHNPIVQNWANNELTIKKQNDISYIDS